MALVLAVLGAALADERPESCGFGPTLPPSPLYATSHNGIALKDICYGRAGDAEAHFFVIGDWGGKPRELGEPPQPARNREVRNAVDDSAQQRVADQMDIRAEWRHPDFIVNVGDNFYWAGVTAACGSVSHDDITGQFRTVFEDVYNGSNIRGLPWFGVLGNHDYGGWMFTAAWDNTIGYTWGASGRWLTPAQFWSQTVRYPNCTVDFFFLDTNVNDAHPPGADQDHNICSERHNPPNASCGVQGPQSVDSCHRWFQTLWEAQMNWLQPVLDGSTADWQVIVTHFPPDHNMDVWPSLVERYGVDLYISGHRHLQEVYYGTGTVLGQTGVIVSGGGGGITSESVPDVHGRDDQYGFVDVGVSRDKLTVEMVSHSGVVRETVEVAPRPRLNMARKQAIEAAETAALVRAAKAAAAALEEAQRAEQASREAGRAPEAKGRADTAASSTNTTPSTRTTTATPASSSSAPRPRELPTATRREADTLTPLRVQALPSVFARRQSTTSAPIHTQAALRGPPGLSLAEQADADLAMVLSMAPQMGAEAMVGAGSTAHNNGGPSGTPGAKTLARAPAVGYALGAALAVALAAAWAQTRRPRGGRPWTGPAANELPPVAAPEPEARVLLDSDAST